MGKVRWCVSFFVGYIIHPTGPCSLIILNENTIITYQHNIQIFSLDQMMQNISFIYLRNKETQQTEIFFGVLT